MVFVNFLFFSCLCVGAGWARHNMSLSRLIKRQATQQAICPVKMGDVVINYLTALTSNIDGWRNFELSPFLVTRVPWTPGNQQVRQHIITNFRNLGWTVEEDISVQTTPFGPAQFVNVIATHNPAAKTRLVLACHYDTKLIPVGYDVSFQFIFFDGEEAYLSFSATDGLYGSRHLASVWENTLDPLVPGRNRLAGIGVFILLDLIGSPSTQIQRFYPESDGLFTILVQIENCLRARGLLTRPVGSPPLFQDATRTSPIEDDHVPFQLRGVGIMHLISSPFPPTWHTLLDNSATLDYNLIEDFIRIFKVFVTHLAVESRISSPV